MYKYMTLIIIMVGLLMGMTFGNIDHLGYVVVSPEGPIDGGDFGPYTPGTQTSGIQEAFDYAKTIVSEVYIVGGPGVVYDIDTTLRIPWGQDWHCDGGDYTLNFSLTSGDCMIIDSQMNCVFNFGNIVAPSLTSEAVVRLWPTTIGPDNFVVLTSSYIKFNSIAGGGGSSVGLQLDNPIYSEIRVGEIEDCGVGMKVNSGTNNTIHCPLIRACNTMIQAIGGSLNDITASLNPDGLTGTTGAVISSSANTFHLTWVSGFDAGDSLVFESGANSNLVNAINLAVAGITNNSISKTNKIVSATESIGFALGTPSVPSSGNYQVNNTCYSVVITILTPGTVSSWTLRDSSGSTDTISAGLYAGQSVCLEPGESVKFNYGVAPTWSWRVLK